MYKVYFWSAEIPICGIWVNFLYEGHPVEVKITAAKARISLFRQRKISIGNNSGPLEDKAVKFSYIWDFLLRWIEWCNCHLCHVTGNTRIRRWFKLD